MLLYQDENRLNLLNIWSVLLWTESVVLPTPCLISTLTMPCSALNTCQPLLECSFQHWCCVSSCAHICWQGRVLSCRGAILLCFWSACSKDHSQDEFSSRSLCLGIKYFSTYITALLCHLAVPLWLFASTLTRTRPWTYNSMLNSLCSSIAILKNSDTDKSRTLLSTISCHLMCTQVCFAFLLILCYMFYVLLSPSSASSSLKAGQVVRWTDVLKGYCLQSAEKKFSVLGPGVFKSWSCWWKLRISRFI